ENGRCGFRPDGGQPATGDRARAGADRLGGRVLYRTKAISERGLLLRHYLPGAWLSGRYVSRALRDPSHGRMAGAMAGNDRGPGAEDRPTATGVRRGGAP